MGPIEREIRGMTALLEHMWLDAVLRRVSMSSYRAIRDSSELFGDDGVAGAYKRDELPDVLSEAIEAAEALGL